MSTDEIREVVWGDHKDFKTVVGESVIDTGRWENFMEMVVQQVSTGKFYQIEWEEGATEYQECDFDPRIYEVFPKEVTQTIYVTKQG